MSQIFRLNVFKDTLSNNNYPLDFVDNLFLCRWNALLLANSFNFYTSIHLQLSLLEDMKLNGSYNHHFVQQSFEGRLEWTESYFPAYVYCL